MPQGHGRYGIEDADHVAENGSAQTFEWYLKNHLGSTMLVYGTGGTSGGLKAAYDYRSFGEQIELTSPSTGKVTENFTGKEHDDEIALDYFGARYLDPMLGMWISVDPMRQFASPYLYAGNGVNPINGVDDDGNVIELLNNQQQLLTQINRLSYNQYTLDENNRLVSAGTCNERGSKVYSERLNAAISSKASIFVGMYHGEEKIRNAGEGLTIMENGLAFVGITGDAFLNSSSEQNLLHELVGHAIPYILMDRLPSTSAVMEEVQSLPENLPLPAVPSKNYFGDGDPAYE